MSLHEKCHVEKDLFEITTYGARLEFRALAAFRRLRFKTSVKLRPRFRPISSRISKAPRSQVTEPEGEDPFLSSYELPYARPLHSGSCEAARGLPPQRSHGDTSDPGVRSWRRPPQATASHRRVRVAGGRRRYCASGLSGCLPAVALQPGPWGLQDAGVLPWAWNSALGAFSLRPVTATVVGSRTRSLPLGAAASPRVGAAAPWGVRSLGAGRSLLPATPHHARRVGDPRPLASAPTPARTFTFCAGRVWHHRAHGKGASLRDLRAFKMVLSAWSSTPD